jgi:hypothetical protein
VQSLNENDLVPTTLTVREPSLDDVFLSLTGQRTKADETGTAVPVARSRR